MGSFKEPASESDLRSHELNHRLGNIFALFQALITASRTGAGSVDEFEEDLRNRVEALSTAQSVSMANPADRIALGELCELALRPFGDDASRHLDGPAMTLGADATSALALALHELATNAVKHGSLGKRGGRVEIRWRIAGDGGLRLVWAERGGPPASPPDRTSFGMRLIHLMLEQRLGGNVSIEFAAEGLSARIRLPAEHVLTPPVARQGNSEGQGEEMPA